MIDNFLRMLQSSFVRIGNVAFVPVKYAVRHSNRVEIGISLGRLDWIQTFITSITVGLRPSLVQHLPLHHNLTRSPELRVRLWCSVLRLHYNCGASRPITCK